MIAILVLRKLAPYIAIVVVALAIFYTGYTKGVSNTKAVYEERIMEERVRLMTANETALAEAAATQVDLARKLRERDAIIKDLATEAAIDVHAHRPALSSASVQRIDRIN